MPSIIRQRVAGPTNKNGQPPRTASILDSAVAIDQLANQWIQMVIYGQNRVGKTTLACQFPKPLLLVSLEPSKTGGANSVKRVPSVVYLRLESSAQAVTLARELKASGGRSAKWQGALRTVVVDSVTSLQDIVLKEILNLPSVPEMLRWGMVDMDGYRERSEKTRECIRPFLDLDCHVVFTAKERDHNPPKDERKSLTRGMQQESFFAADLGGATAGWLMDACDYVGQLYLAKETVTKDVVAGGKKVSQREEETGRVVRRLRTMYHPNFAAGFRSSCPESVPEYLENPTWSAIKELIDGE